MKRPAVPFELAFRDAEKIISVLRFWLEQVGDAPCMERRRFPCFAAGPMKGEPIAEHDHRSRRGEEFDAGPPGDAPGVPGQVIDVPAVRSEDRCVEGLDVIYAGKDAELIREPRGEEQQGNNDEYNAKSFFCF
jgi:hypothetical protein